MTISVSGGRRGGSKVGGKRRFSKDRVSGGKRKSKGKAGSKKKSKSRRKSRK